MHLFRGHQGQGRTRHLQIHHLFGSEVVGTAAHGATEDPGAAIAAMCPKHSEIFRSLTELNTNCLANELVPRPIIALRTWSSHAVPRGRSDQSSCGKTGVQTSAMTVQDAIQKVYQVTKSKIRLLSLLRLALVETIELTRLVKIAGGVTNCFPNQNSKVKEP